MDCREILENSSAFIDGELDAAAVAELREHLGSCVSCAETLRGFEESSTTVSRNLKSIELRPEVWLRIHSRIAELPVPGARPGFWGRLFEPRLRFAGAVTLLVVALVGGSVTVVMHRRSQAELQAYMDQYVQSRHAASETDSTEEATWWRPPHAAVRRGDNPENPFLDVDYSRPIVNPFEAEGK